MRMPFNGMVTMVRISLSPVDQVAADAAIAHYDQLHDPAKEQFPELVRRRAGTVDERTAHGFRSCEYVKYTDYYRIELE